MRDGGGKPYAAAGAFYSPPTKGCLQGGVGRTHDKGCLFRILVNVHF